MSDAPRNLVKKTSAKLNLKRETLRRLQTLSAGELGAVVAGVDVGWPYTALCKTK